MIRAIVLDKKHLLLIISITLMIIILNGCSKDDVSKVEDFVSDIEVEITNKSSMPSGEYYNLKIYNGSKYELKYLEVQLGFNVNEKAKNDGLMGPLMFRGKASDLPINIQSGEEKDYNVFVPVGLIKQEYIDMDKVQIHLIGYKTKVEATNRFEMFGPI